MSRVRRPVECENPDGAGPFVILCDHASNRIPDACRHLGFEEEALATHIAWDPGALGVSRHLARRLDAPLIWPDVSRLVIDCNRPPASPTLIVTQSEGRAVQANVGLDAAERSRRVAEIHCPYHDAIDACLERKFASGVSPSLIAVHSYTPVFLGQARPWQIGIVFAEDRRLADPLVETLARDPALKVGVNQPYSPVDEVYYTVARHAHPRGLPGVMIEIRNNEIATEHGQRKWASRLADFFLSMRSEGSGAHQAAV